MTDYIHGTTVEEQRRLADLNHLTNAPFLNFLDGSGAKRILEVGSGLGILLNEVAAAFPQAQCFGIEYSREQLAAAKPRGNVTLQQGDAHQLPFESNSFDVVYCRYLLEHVANPDMVLREVARVLRPGGRFFAQENNILVSVTDPACPAFERVWRKFVMLQEKLGGDALVGAKLYGKCKHAGFEEIQLSLAPEAHHFGQPSFRAWIENLIGNVHGARQRLIEFSLATELEIETALAELRDLIHLEDASAYFYWNRVQARKPASN